MVFSRFFFDLIGMVGEVFDHEAFALCNWVFDEDEHGFFAELVGIEQIKLFSPWVCCVQACFGPLSEFSGFYFRVVDFGIFELLDIFLNPPLESRISVPLRRFLLAFMTNEKHLPLVMILVPFIC